MLITVEERFLYLCHLRTSSAVPVSQKLHINQLISERSALVLKLSLHKHNNATLCNTNVPLNDYRRLFAFSFGATVPILVLSNRLSIFTLKRLNLFFYV